jgi:hypothetical protein
MSGELLRIEAQATNFGLFSSTAMSKNLSESFKESSKVSQPFVMLDRAVPCLLNIRLVLGRRRIGIPPYVFPFPGKLV